MTTAIRALTPSLVAVFIGVLTVFTLAFSLQATSSFPGVQTIPECRDQDTWPSPVREVRFERNQAFFDISPAGDDVWNKLLPENGGFHNATGHSGESVALGISMFHQLHCLQMIRARIQKDLGIVHEPTPYNHTHHEGSRHFLHCFDYLVQAITCAADGALEHPFDENEVVNGYGTLHQCRDSDSLWKLAEQPARREA